MPEPDASPPPPIDEVVRAADALAAALAAGAGSEGIGATADTLARAQAETENLLRQTHAARRGTPPVH